MGDLRGIGQVFVCWKENGCPGEEIFRRGEINFALFSFYMNTVLSIEDERERGHGLGQILQLETKAIDWDRLVR